MHRDNIFDKIACLYNHTLPEHITSHYLAKRIKFISRFIKDKTAILDIGCGTGILAGALSALNIKTMVTGCDSSLEMLKIGKNNKEIKLTCCDSHQLSYKNDSFDIIISIALFHHLNGEDSIFNTIKEMVRIAKKNAIIIIWDANLLNPYWRFLFKKMPQDQEVKKVVALRKIINFIRKQNLVFNLEVYHSGWIPDFASKRMFPFWRTIEYIFERMPVVKLFSAHYIMVINVINKNLSYVE